MILIKGLDVIDMIRKSHSYLELKFIRDALHDEHQISMMSNRKVFEALELVHEKLQLIPKEELVKEILESFLW